MNKAMYLQQAMCGMGKEGRELKGFNGVKGQPEQLKGKCNKKQQSVCIYKKKSKCT